MVGPEPAGAVPNFVAGVVSQISSPAIISPGAGEPYVEFDRYLECYMEACNTGAIFGYALRGNPLLLGKILAEPGREAGFFYDLQDLAGREVARQQDGTPSDTCLGALMMHAERLRAENLWGNEAQSAAEFVRHRAPARVPATDAQSRLISPVFVGLGAGIFFPEFVRCGIEAYLRSKGAQALWCALPSRTREATNHRQHRNSEVGFAELTARARFEVSRFILAVGFYITSERKCSRTGATYRFVLTRGLGAGGGDLVRHCPECELVGPLPFPILLQELDKDGAWRDAPL